jgi:hypothetical protein
MNDFYLRTLPRNVPETDWIVPLVLFVSILFLVSRFLFPRYHNRISHAFFNRYETNKLISEKNVLFSRGGFILNLVPLFCIAMLAYQQVALFRPEVYLTRPFLHYAGILLLVILYFGGRLAVIQLFGYSFEQKEVALRFNQVWLLQFENLGTYILIPALAFPFTTGTVRIILMILLWATLGLWVIYTAVRELELLKSYRVSIFYMFLYLCTLEILPLWWVIQSITEGW